MNDILRRPTTPLGWLAAALATTAAALLAVNLLLIGTHLVAWGLNTDDDLRVDELPRARTIDEVVWRSRAPTDASYRDLAAQNVEVVVDLRAERVDDPPNPVFDEVGLELVRIPIRDGQTPTSAQVAAFLEVLDRTEGRVLLHCGAGVGRTGVMAAAYTELRTEQDVSNLALLWENFQIGPPSIEQVYYALTVDDSGLPDQPPAMVSAVSRFFDGPRRLAHVILGDE